MERFPGDPNPRGGAGQHGDDEDPRDNNDGRLAALAFISIVALAAAVIFGAQHMLTAPNGCAVQDGGVCLALSGQ